MNNSGQELPDHKMEIVIGNLLRTGVITAASVVFAGAIFYIVYYGASAANYKVFHRASFELSNIGAILRNTFSGHGRGLIQTGLLLLIATPIARVALSIFVFARKRDILYVIISAIVFCVLIYSILNKS